MIAKKNLLALSKAQKWIWGFMTPTLLVTGLSLTFIWVFLYRLGREDLFLQVVTFKDLFSPLAFFSMTSIFFYMIVFFIQSIVSVLILRREISSFSDYSRIKNRYLLAFVACSFFSSIILLMISFYFPKYPDAFWVVPAEFMLTAILEVLISFSLNRAIINTKTLFMEGWEKRLFKLKFHVLYPFLLGVASWCFVFPLGLLIKYIDFSPDSSKVFGFFSLVGFTTFIIILSLLPGLTFLSLPNSMRVSRQLIAVTFMTIVAISFSSVVASVIPVQIINLSMKLSGVTKYENYYYSVSRDVYPPEMFSSKNWHFKKSENNKQYIFKGFPLFSFGTVSLICPEDVADAITKSMKFILLNTGYDNKLRKELSMSTRTCNVIARGEFKSWKAID